MPNAQGFSRPITVIAPLGSIVNPTAPAACGARGITGFRMMDCIMGALSQALPGRIPADGSGGSTIPSIGGTHKGRAFVFVETMMGTWGGAPDHDGQDGVAHIGANQSNVPIEMIEREHPLRIERYGLVPDTGGAGKYRGGLAIVRELRLLGDDAVITVRSDKRRFPPYGLHGGKQGSPSMNLINPGPAQRVLPVLFKDPVDMVRGDLYHHTLSGGGGYGDPLERDLFLVQRDLRQGRVTGEGALRDYGVVAALQDDEWIIDVPATGRQRCAMSTAAKA